MKTTVRLVDMLLRGKTDQFKTVMKEELEWRTSILIEKLYKIESKNALIKEQSTDCKQEIPIIEEFQLEDTEIESNKFVPETTYFLKDGQVGILSEYDKTLISKLYEKLNNDNKERMVKLLSESKESFNRVLNLAKAEDKK
jgi:hypothetical protein